jgi:HTH-type transcriptional repressor of NAD biosynthesis genes
MKKDRGLIMGRFHPPHAGHDFLITQAQAKVEALTVIVVDRPGVWIPLDLRVAWLKEAHPTVEVLPMPDPGLGDDSQAWAEYVRDFLGYTPDVLFSSEAYGERYAQLLGAEHLAIDPARTQMPISAREILANLDSNSHYLRLKVADYVRSVMRSSE